MDRALPRIPHHGVASRLTPEVLISSVTDKGPIKVTGGPSKFQTHAALYQKLPHKQHTPSIAEQIRHALYQKDTVCSPRLPSSVLQGVDTASQRELSYCPTPLQSKVLHGEGSSQFDSLQDSSFRFEQSIGTLQQSASMFSAITQGSLFGGQSLGPSELAAASRTERPCTRSSVSNSKGIRSTARDAAGRPVASEPNLSGAAAVQRARHLRACFVRPRSEIQAKLTQLEETLRHERPLKDQGLCQLPTAIAAAEHEVPCWMSTASSANGELQAQARAEKQQVLETGEDGELLKLAFQSLFRAAREAMLSKVAPMESLVTGATREELIYACDFLNLIRWLCGLPPVHLEKNCIGAMDLLSQALLPRKEATISKQSQQYSAIHNYAQKLTELVGVPGRCIILHRETSLINSIGECLNCGFLPELHIASGSSTGSWRKASGPLAGSARAKFVRAILARASRYAKRMPPPILEPPKLTPNVKLLHAISKERGKILLMSLPPSLEGLSVLWALSEGRGEDGDVTVPSWLYNSAGRVSLMPLCGGDAGGGAAVGGEGVSGRPPFAARQASRPATTLSSSRPSTRGGLGLGLPSARGATPRQRAIEWSPEAQQQAKNKARACTLCWGDTTEAVTFRRYLLNPALRDFGASRLKDTCVLWTAEDPGLTRRLAAQSGEGAEAQARGADSGMVPETDIVCFPPPGLFPLELLLGLVPIWTVMPLSHLFQPTQDLKVRMWRIRLERARPDDPMFDSCDDTLVTGAERLEEVTLESISVDCSTKGNPFCIFFRPALSYIDDGDQFEVEISGLRGHEGSRHFFHEFSSLRDDRKDHHLMGVAKELVDVMNKKSLWRVDGGSATGLLQPGDIGASDTEANLVVVEDLASNMLSQQGDGVDQQMEAERYPGYPDIGLVSHPSRSISTDSVDVTISLWCPDVVAMRAHLHLVRVANTEEVPRACVVLRIREYFLVRVKLPMASCRYELSFWAAPKSSPDGMIEHWLKYEITTTENCQNLLHSMEHPMRQMYGYALQPPACHQLGVSVLAPLQFRVQAGYVYFLAYIDPEAHRFIGAFSDKATTAAAAAGAATSRAVLGTFTKPAKALFGDRLGVVAEQGQDEEPEVVEFQLRRHSKLATTEVRGLRLREQVGASGRGGAHARVSSGTPDSVESAPPMPRRRGVVRPKTHHAEPQEVPVVRMLHTALAEKLSSSVQACHQMAHVDVSLVDAPDGEKRTVRCVLRLRRRSDLSELHDGLLYFSDQDVGGRVEMHIHFPLGQDFPPLKIGEWLIARKDALFPIGF